MTTEAALYCINSGYDIKIFDIDPTDLDYFSLTTDNDANVFSYDDEEDL